MQPGNLNTIIKIELVISLAHRNSGLYRCCTSFVNLGGRPTDLVALQLDEVEIRHELYLAFDRGPATGISAQPVLEDLGLPAHALRSGSG